MYKSRRGVDRSHLGNRRKKGAVVFCFFFFPLGSGNLAQSPRVAGGRSPSSRGSGAWKLSPGGKQQEEGTGSCRHTWDLPAGVSARRNSAWTYSCLLLQQPVRAVMSQHHPKCLPLPGSQQLALLTLAQSSGQGFLFPGFPPTALKCPCTGPCPRTGCDYFRSTLCTVPFREPSTCSHSHRASQAQSCSFQRGARLDQSRSSPRPGCHQRQGASFQPRGQKTPKASFLTAKPLPWDRKT